MDKEVTREQLEQIIKEELEKEGFLNRVMAKAQGNKAAIGHYAKNVGNALAGNASTSTLSPGEVKQLTMAQQRLMSFNKSFTELYRDVGNDLQLLFKTIKNPEVQQAIKGYEDSVKNMSAKLINVRQDIGQALGKQGTQQQAPQQPQAQHTEPGEPPEAGKVMLPQAQYQEPVRKAAAPGETPADVKAQARQYALRKMGSRGKEE